MNEQNVFDGAPGPESQQKATPRPDWGYISTSDKGGKTAFPGTTRPTAYPSNQNPAPLTPFVQYPPPSANGFIPPGSAFPYQRQAYFAYDAFPAPVALPKGMSVASLVLGIISIFLFPLIAGVLAIIFGSIGIGRYNRGEGGGKGMAVAGLVLGIIGIVFWIFYLATMGMPSLP